MVKSRRRKATQPDDRRQDRLRVSERHGGAASDREGRQFGDSHRVHCSSSRSRKKGRCDSGGRAL